MTGTPEGSMITEDLWQVRRRRTPSVQRTLPAQSHIPRPGCREGKTFAQTPQQFMLGPRIRTWDMLEANGAKRLTP